MEDIQAQLKRRIGPFSVGVWIIIVVAGIGLGLVARRKFFPAPKGGREDTSGSVVGLPANDSQAFPDGRVGVTGAPNIVQLPPIIREIEGPERIVTKTIVERDETLIKEQDGIIRLLRDRVRRLVALNEDAPEPTVRILGQNVPLSMADRFEVSEPFIEPQEPGTVRILGQNVPLSAIPTGTRYVVRSGDTLTKIGQRFGVPWPTIYQANRAVIGSNPDVIIPGQILVIPKAA